MIYDVSHARSSTNQAIIVPGFVSGNSHSAPKNFLPRSGDVDHRRRLVFSSCTATCQTGLISMIAAVVMHRAVLHSI